MDINCLITWLSETTVAHVPVLNLCFAAAATLLAYLTMTTVLRVVIHRLAKLAQRTTTQADDMLVEMLRSTKRSLVLLIALLIGAGLLDLPDRWANRVNQLWFVVLVLQVGFWANRVVSVGLRQYAERHAAPGTQSVGAAATLMSWGLRTLVWAVVLLAMLSNLGINITAFVASLGVGGIAVALAAQNILGDLFASVSIALDKPFEVGDFIVFGKVAGSVELVGVKTTRIRSLGGEQIVMSNTELLKQTVSNYKRLRERRIVFGFRVTYDTTADQARAIPEIVKRVVQSSDGVRFDRAHFKAFGEHSLEYEVVYIVLSPDYTTYMNEQQRINLALMDEFETLEVNFALPTRMIHLMNAPPTGVGGRDETATGDAAPAAIPTS